MIDLIVIVLFLTLTGWIAGYREVESMEKQGNWIGWSRLKFWKYMKIFKWKFKILDSYHFMGGVRVLLNTIAVVGQGFWLVWSGTLIVQFIFLVDILTSNFWIGIAIAVAHIPLYWWFWYYQRNIFMHIIARKKEYRQLKYWNPFQIKKEK